MELAITTWCFPAVGLSSAPSPGSTAAEGLPRIGRTSIARRWHSCASHQSASCSENFVIPLDVPGQTLRIVETPKPLYRLPFRHSLKSHYPRLQVAISATQE